MNTEEAKREHRRQGHATTFESLWTAADRDEKAAPVQTEGEVRQLCWVWFMRGEVAGYKAQRQDGVRAIEASIDPHPYDDFDDGYNAGLREAVRRIGAVSTCPSDKNAG